MESRKWPLSNMMLKAIHSQESKAAAREKAALVAEKLRELKLTAAAKKVEEGIEETITYMDYPTEHWNRIRTNNTTERVNREIKRRTKAIGAFPDGQSALMLVCARLRHVAATDWGSKRYLNMDICLNLNFSASQMTSSLPVTPVHRRLKMNLRKIIDTILTTAILNQRIECWSD